MNNTNIKNINIGSLNIRGCKDKYKQDILIKDINRYNIQICGIQETHIPEDNLIQLKSTLQKSDKTYLFYHVGAQNNSKHGSGIIVEKELNPLFSKISDRICQVKVKINSKDLYVISAYAPTLKTCETHPEQKEQFYDELEQAINKVKSKHALVVVGDFNAKTGQGHKEFPENTGKFDKGLTNSSGRTLLELTHRNSLVITNTVFQHKQAHRTTWTSPDGTYKNQIDYIITKLQHKNLVTNSRSYGGIESYTDHNLVKTQINFRWSKMKTTKRNTVPRINLENFNDKMKQEEYKQKVEQSYKENQQKQTALTETTNQQKWTNIVNIYVSKQAKKQWA